MLMYFRCCDVKIGSDVLLILIVRIGGLCNNIVFDNLVNCAMNDSV